jgi:hypothetical protein
MLILFGERYDCGVTSARNFLGGVEIQRALMVAAERYIIAEKCSSVLSDFMVVRMNSFNL